MKAESEIRKRIEDLELLKTAALDISSGRERHELYEEIAVSIAELLDCDASGIAIFHEDKHTITFPYVYNLRGSLGNVEFKLDEDIFSKVIHSQQSLRITNYPGLPYRIDIFDEAQLQSLAVIPLKIRGRVLGILFAASRKAEREFTDYDMVLLESIGAQSAVAVDNVNLYDAQRFISSVLQRGFLPEKIPALTKTDIGIFYASATEEAVVGGDFYDFVPLGNETLAFALGDSSGKGVEATADAAMVKYSLRSALYQDPDPVNVLTRANAVASHQLEEGHFVTLVYSYYDEPAGSMRIGIAGHPYPIHYSADAGQISFVAGQDPAFGLIADHQYHKVELTLAPNDILVMFTDGLIELRRDLEFFGNERLGHIIAANATFSAKEIADKVIEAAREFSMGRFTDDIVLMVLKRTS